MKMKAKRRSSLLSSFIGEISCFIVFITYLYRLIAKVISKDYLRKREKLGKTLNFEKLDLLILRKKII